MQVTKRIYTFTYDNTESDLCKLESRYIFNQEEKNRVLLSDILVEPSTSAFIKNRLDVMSFSKDYSSLLSQIKKENIRDEGFKVEYLVFDGDKTDYSSRLEKLREIGFAIHGYPDYKRPSTIYALCCVDGTWYFGTLVKNNFKWQEHNKKPCSYSNSITTNIAKALVNIAINGHKSAKLLDACCGVGTIILEACFAEIDIDGCDINWRIVKNARANISHFNYDAKVFCSDVKGINKSYDAVIVDLPYNLVSRVTESDVFRILESAAAITDRVVIVSTSDITNMIAKIGFKISDHCRVSKKGKGSFARRIWVCQRSKDH